jgi:CDP-glucose 4,6-dehydratase
LRPGRPTTLSLFALARMDEVIPTITGDIRELAAVEEAAGASGPEPVFHPAAQALVNRSIADPVGTHSVNVLGTVTSWRRSEAPAATWARWSA